GCSSIALAATSTTEIPPLSLHDALPICDAGPDLLGPGACPGPGRGAGGAPARPPHRSGTGAAGAGGAARRGGQRRLRGQRPRLLDRKSTRLNSSHVSISYAVFCLKKTTQ